MSRLYDGQAQDQRTSIWTCKMVSVKLFPYPVRPGQATRQKASPETAPGVDNLGLHNLADVAVARDGHHAEPAYRLCPEGCSCMVQWHGGALVYTWVDFSSSTMCGIDGHACRYERCMVHKHVVISHLFAQMQRTVSMQRSLQLCRLCACLQMTKLSLPLSFQALVMRYRPS